MKRSIRRLGAFQRYKGGVSCSYYEYEFNFYQIAAMEHCTASAIQKSVAIAKEKVKAEIEKISPTVPTPPEKEICFLFVWDWRHYISHFFPWE